MKHKDSAHNSPVRSPGSLAGALKPSSNQRVAKVLERAIAPSILPDSVQLGDKQVDTAQFIGELSDVAHHSGTENERDQLAECE